VGQSGNGKLKKPESPISAPCRDACSLDLTNGDGANGMIRRAVSNQCV
jgi:hypothetical protein